MKNRLASACTLSFLSAFAMAVALSVFIPLQVQRLDAQDDLARRPLEHEDYDVWNTISDYSISRDGNWVKYSVQSGAIDGESILTIRNIESQEQFSIERANQSQFSFDSRFVVFMITPEKQLIKELKKKETPSEELPLPQLQILQLATGQLVTVDRVKSFALPEENGDWVACLLDKPVGEDELQTKPATARESYEVSPEGLSRPKKELKLKKRTELDPGRTAPVEEPAKKEGGPNKEASASQSNEACQQETKPGEDDKKEKQVGTPLVLISLKTGIQRTYQHVIAYKFSKNGKVFAYATSVELPEDLETNEDGEKAANSSQTTGNKPDQRSSADDSADGVSIVKLDSLEHLQLVNGVGEYRNLAFDDDGSHLAFITNKDDYLAISPSWALYLWKNRDKTARRIAAEGDQGIPAGWWVAGDSSQRFSEDGKRLYFETAPIPDDVIKERAAAPTGQQNADSDDDDDKAKLDIWHWQDPQLQPQQLLLAEIERNRDYVAAYQLRSRKIVQIATREIPEVGIDERSDSAVAIANTDMPYRKMLSWDVPGFRDAYLVNLDTGRADLTLKQVKWNAAISPEGRYITWFDPEQLQWFSKPTDNPAGEPLAISAGIEYALQDELHDTPMLPSAYGAAGWLDDDAAFLVYDRYDIWKLDPEGDGPPVCLTRGFGRENKTRFRYLRRDREERAIDPETPLILSAFNEETKASGFYSLSLKHGEGKNNREDPVESADTESMPRQLIMLDENLAGLARAEESENVVFSRSTFRMCPDIWSSDLNFQTIQRVSDINPQQQDYRWGTAELIHWNAADGDELDGILYKPDGFDPQKKYPLMVYFYERNSDSLHRYYPPAAGRSIINHSFYVSRGYLLFVPDIPYKTGEPGPSAANAVLPGIQSLIAQGFVDEKRIGVQGHSWGGYQIAYLVTQTDMFACAESGAPVSNMTSAYGGIRWSSGISRMFQYERTQSRIGEDLWAARDKYIANSPLFFADKINTPLLILHNDKDGAVPWYQGIELFVALRRLEKKAWMLNYNDNPHWVMGEPNRRDFAIRMQQFFDHYLIDAPEPEWMAVGIPAVDKGKNYGLELLEPESEEPENQGEKTAK